jgi:hypothetical protein
MPNYKITAPDGKNFVVTAPEGASQDEVMAYAQSHWNSLGGAPSAPAPGVGASLAAGAGEGMGRAALGTEQLLGNALTFPTLQNAAGQPATAGIPGYLNRITNVENIPGSALKADAARGLAKIDSEAAPYQAAHPIATDVGQIVGSTPAAMIPAGAAGDLATGTTWAERAGLAARVGGTVGAEQPVDPSKTGRAYWAAKAKETGENVAGAVALGQGVEGANLLSSGIGHWMGRNAPDALNYAAARTIAKRVAQDEKGGHPSATDMIELINTAHQQNVPLSLMEVGGPNVRALAGSAARGKGTAKTIISSSFQDRIAGARERMIGSVRSAFNAPQGRRAVSEALSASQRKASEPLYDEALKPGSLAPLEKQFESAFNEASRNKKQATDALAAAKQGLTLAAAKVARAGTNVYSNSAALREMRVAQGAAQDAHDAVAAAELHHQNIIFQLRAAQSAEAAGHRGGVWSPHIARLMANPKVQKGIQAGLAIQRDEADALNIPFNPRDYAITGTDSNGNSIVSKVPNMRLLDAAKKGLDDMLETYRDTTSGRLVLDEQGRKINELRLALIHEVDRINPSYKAARAAWAGPAASKGAMKLGEGAIRNHADDVKDIYESLSPSEKEHYKIGAAQAYMDAISEGGVTAPVVRKIAEDDSASMAKRRLRPLFSSEAKLDKFISSVTGERSIHAARQEILGNSATAGRLAEDTSPDVEMGLHIARGVAHAKTGNVPALIRTGHNVYRYVTGAANPELNEAIARSLAHPQIPVVRKAGEAVPIPPKPIPRGNFLNRSPLSSALAADAVTGVQNTQTNP